MKYIKYCLLLAIFFLGFTSLVFAQPQTFERNNDNNYLVHKDIKVTSSNLNNIRDTYAVDAKEKVYDFAQILTDDEEAQLKSKLESFIKDSNMDAVIIIDNLNYGNDFSYNTFASDFYDYNDFGIDFEHYSGILFLRDANSSFPYFNIYAFGNAQLYYSSERMEIMLDNILNSFSGFNSTGGYYTFIEQINTYYNMGIPEEMNHYYIDENGFLVKEFVPPIMLSIIIAAIVTIIVVSILVNKNKMIKKATKALNYLDINSINFTVKHDKFIRDSISSYTVSSSSGSSGSGFGGGSGRSSMGSSGRGFSSGSGRRG